ncbi:DUF6081 family protein [Streptomyces sp. BPTC-684]|uniref:DUF6081 family protein n=1 Tax=Streptomyces sp. BPTC-684 TaxID=3043734 RepID=UPI0024B0EFAF|nr:DUF6081 family protein [Streptomyces sp. BPTC-684]WHM40058.1 DUF6081 family protein [Streptomyces sp. BPTC-684]
MTQDRMTRHRTLFQDDFRHGFDTAGRWRVPPLEKVLTTCSRDGLTVTPAGVDPETGQPAFSCSADQGGGAPGAGDHIKWVALIGGSGSGRTAFEVPAVGRLECSMALSALSLGGDRHPFGAAVRDPDSDVRLATAVMITMDPVSHVVCDFVLTNTRVYALYERVPSPGSSYAAFSYAVPAAVRTPGQWHDLAILVENDGRRVLWRVDGDEVLRVGRLGHRLPDRRHMLLDHGGEEGEPVRLGALVCGVGMLTMLDGAGPDGRGLVRLDPTPGHYFSPRQGAPYQQEFMDGEGLAGSRSWGAGAVLNLREVAVRRTVDSAGGAA